MSVKNTFFISLETQCNKAIPRLVSYPSPPLILSDRTNFFAFLYSLVLYSCWCFNLFIRRLRSYYLKSFLEQLKSEIAVKHWNIWVVWRKCSSKRKRSAPLGLNLFWIGQSPTADSQDGGWERKCNQRGRQWTTGTSSDWVKEHLKNSLPHLNSWRVSKKEGERSYRGKLCRKANREMARLTVQWRCLILQSFRETPWQF